MVARVDARPPFGTYSESLLTQDGVCHRLRQDDLPALTTVVSGRDPRAVFVQLPFHGRCGRLVVAVLALVLAG